ncbi:unnamed protein product [Trifolium pratense]|uniref:Uncharacterized protein n=1 Tax=Trifolium pratense TaxID=57577 RepID=A0ACB0IGH1_TRIPR|nr:unnamed protein product [Trifolium pratense]
MDKPSSSSKRSWIWVIEALASYNKFPITTLQDLIDAAPVTQEDFTESAKEFIALRCLEELSPFTPSSTVPLDSSRTCLDVFDQIMNQEPSSNLDMSNLTMTSIGADFFKWDLNSFIMHKRASNMKCQLEKMKDSILDGNLQLPDKLKEMSGLFPKNRANMACVNEGKRDYCSVKGDGNSTYAEDMRAKENSACLLLKDGNKASKKSLTGNNRLCSKRTRVDLTDENSGSCLNETEDFIIKYNEFIRSTEKIKCNASTDFDSKKEKQVSRLGKEVSENSVEEIQIPKNVGHHSEMNNTETLCDESLEDDGSSEDTHTMCTTSNLCQSSGQHTCEDETIDTVHVDPIPINDVIDIDSEAELSSDSDVYHNEKIALTNKKDEFLRSQHAFGQPNKKKPNVASSNVSQKPVASDKGVVDAGSEAELSSDSDMYHNEEIALTAKKDEFPRSRHAFGQDLPAMTESTGQNLCIKCNEAGQLLVCQTSTCSLMMHKNCLVDSAQLDGNGNFLCPFCGYSRTISEYLEAKKSASLAKKQLAIFKSKRIRN